jgi:hypothetical protein
MRLLLYFVFAAYTSAICQPTPDNPMNSEVFSRSIYFKPNEFNPSGIGIFGRGTIGFIDSTIFNINLNPSYLSQNRSTNIYLDYRGNDINGFYYPKYSINYPFNTEDDRYQKELVPKYNAAILLTPIKILSGALGLGITYQMVEFLQDESLYAVFPKREDFPLSRRISEGGDDASELGHFITLYSAYSLYEYSFGIKFNYSQYKLDNNSPYYSYFDSDPLQPQFKNNLHKFKQYEIAPGFLYNLSDKIILGITGGYISGDINFSNNFSLGENSAFNDANYNVQKGVKGSLYYYTFHGDYKPKDNFLLKVLYSYKKGDVDLSSSLTSLLDYSLIYNRSSKEGGGQKDLIFQTASVSLTFPISRKTNVTLGLKYNHMSESGKLNEDINRYFYTFHRDTISTKKTAEYNLSSTFVNLTIPLLVEIQFSSQFSLMLGYMVDNLNWDYSIVTQDHYDYYRRSSTEVSIEHEDLLTSHKNTTTSKNDGSSILLSASYNVFDFLKLRFSATNVLSDPKHSGSIIRTLLGMELKF